MKAWFKDVFSIWNEVETVNDLALFIFVLFFFILFLPVIIFVEFFSWLGNLKIRHPLSSETRKIIDDIERTDFLEKEGN